MSGLTLSPSERDLFKIVMAVRQLMEGRSNAVGDVTLTANAGTTTVSAPNCGPGSKVVLFPQTANAAAAVPTTYITLANITAGQFVITHANNAQTDKSFSWVALG